MTMRSPYRAQTDHPAAAEAARAERGTWHLAGVFSSSPSARTAVRLIQAGDPKYPAYQPPGAFEAYAAPVGDELTVWVRYVAGDEPVPPMPDRMTVRVCDRGDGREYVGVCIVTVTISTLCPVCGGPRGWDTVRNHNFHEDGEWLSVDRWTNPCGHLDMYAAVLREARTRQLPPPIATAEDAGEQHEDGDVLVEHPAVALLRTAPGPHAKQAAQLLADNGYAEIADSVFAEIRARKGHMSAKQATDWLASLLPPLPGAPPSTSCTTREDQR